MSETPRIAIVGLGGLFPGAATSEQLWRNVLARIDAASEPPAGRWLLDLDRVHSPGEVRPDRVTANRACFLDPFEVESQDLNVAPDLLAKLDPVFHLALEASRRAWRSAVTHTLDRRRVGVVLGAIALPTEKTSALTRAVLGTEMYDRLGRPCPFADEPMPHGLNVHATGLPAGLVAQALGLGGCAFTLDAACASSLYAVKLAVDELLAGRADAMLAGGLSRPDSLYTQMGFSQLRALSPTGRCSPFDARGDGLVVGEGAGVFVLKRLGDAIRDGDRVLGVIAGVGVSNDVEGGLLAPASEGQLRAMRAAYEQSGWRPDEVDLIECHATGTPVGDKVEFQSLKTLWAEYQGEPGRCVLGAVKSTVGHLLTGAGAAALTKVLFALAERTLPPTANFESPAPGLDMERSPFRVLREAEAWPARSGQPRRAAVSGFGFGGINAHLLIEEWSETSRGRTRGTHAPRSPVSIVAAGATLGPWSDAQLLGVAEPPAPGDAHRGYLLDRVSLPVERFRIPPREIEEMLSQQVLMLEVAGRVLDQSGLGEDERLRTGVYLGVGLDLNTTNFHLRWAVLAHGERLADQAGPPLSANRTMGALASIAASRIARAYRLGGPSFTVSSTETSGVTALHLAVEALRRGEIDAALVGAVDIATDERAVLARGDERLSCDSAVALVLRRGDAGLASVDEVVLGHGEEFVATFDGVEGLVGHAGAAAGLGSVYRACRALSHDVWPSCSGGRYWLSSKNRRAVVTSSGTDGSRAQVTLSEGPAKEELAVSRREGFFAVEGATSADLLAQLDKLRAWLASRVEEDIDALTREWLWSRWRPRWEGLAVAFVPRSKAELLELLAQARSHLERAPDRPLPAEAGRDRIFYAPSPLGREAKLAIVYPGSGNDFPGMGREIGLCWPELLRAQERENVDLESQYLPHLFWETGGAPSVRERIFAQVALGSLLTDLLTGPLALRPDAAIGYSLGESAAFFGLRTWRDRGLMLARMRDSDLFTTQLAGDCEAARAAWGLRPGEPVSWRTVVVERPAAEVRAVLSGLSRVYLQIVNGPRECVVGGQRDAVEEVARRLGCPLVPVPETTTMHCAVVRPVAEAYRALHRLPTTPPVGVRFYSAGLGRAYEVDAESAADAILAQALDTVDFPAVVEAAYEDGVRLFVEAGPGGSCSRMIGAILGGRRHLARSACVPGRDGLGAVWRLVAALVVERIPVAVEGLYGEVAAVGRGSGVEGNEKRSPRNAEEETPSPLLPLPSGASETGVDLSRAVAVGAARGEAHGAFLRFDAALRRTFENAVEFQRRLVEMLLQGAAPGETVTRGPKRQVEEVALDRSQCLEFAIGKIANVLGPAFAEVDAFPTRVRLPDEPLMLVDRIVAIEGEAGSLTQGRVVTEHDVLPGAWYLDAGRIPTCLAVESGQADLFLSGYLGIDSRTRGLAVYRLLDAVVTFHRGLPESGETIRYDIHIDRFFRQGQTHLFRFRFVGSVNGEPVLTMTDGCAGFFTAEELAAGKGVVQTELQLRPRPGIEPDDADVLPQMEHTSYREDQIEALRRGDLAGCFGPLFAGLPLREPATLPGGRLRLVHRVTEMEPRGGRFGIGRIRAEADIHPDDWFLTCHFIDDQVMPGTLMYECCLHTLRVFLMRLGWVGECGEVVCEPVPGVASRLKCRGQVTATTRTVTYEVVLKERGYRPEPYAICDALMYADGKAIVEITDMCLRMTGLTRERIAEVWESNARTGKQDAIYERRHILAFATGKPSEAFGERYRPFDEERFIARLPAPPYSFLDRVVRLNAEPWKMASGGSVEAEYDVPPDEWYFASARAPVMPFAVLLEIPLQVCGWMSAYLGSALTSPEPLHYRNLGGSAELLRAVTPTSGTLTSAVRCTRVAASGGMIIQDFDLEVRDRHGVFYRGSTTFGFFSAQALAQQIGVREATWHTERDRGEAFDYPREAPFPDAMLGMLDRIECFVRDGGPAGLGFVEGTKTVRPEEWFFAAHFYQDPVMPGSLGLEAMLQLLAVVAADRWGVRPGSRFEANLGKHRWMYRGQVIPTNRQMRVQAVVTAVDDGTRQVVADGLLAVDGLTIYRMSDFAVRLL